ncbi:MAG: hypothetical protein ABI444_06730, partial [Candidatus Kapaibacterium sp.]
MKSTQIAISPRLPRESDYAFSAPMWSPYDPDLLALEVFSSVDSSSAGGHSFGVRNIYTYRVSTKECRRISPDTCGPLGPSGIELFDWFPKSTFNSDSMLIGISFPLGQHFAGLYCPRTQILLPYPTDNNVLLEPIVKARSRDGSHIVTIVDDIHSVPQKQTFYLDRSQINAPRTIDVLYHASFSPNSKLVALTVDPVGTGITGADGHFTDT